MKSTKLLFLLSLLLPSLVQTPLWAQRPGVTPTFAYSADECIRYALQFQQAVKEAKFTRASSKAQVDELLARGYPQISATASTQYALKLMKTPVPLEFVTGGATDPDGNPIIPPGTEVSGDNALLEFGTKWQSSAGVQLDQLILDGTYFLGVKAAKEIVELQKYNVSRTEVEAIATIKKAYYNVLVSEQRSKLLNANIESLEATLTDTEAMFKEGYVEQIDLDRLRVQINNLKTERRKVSQLVELNKDLLKFQMGMDPSVKLVLTDELEPAQLQAALADTSYVFDPSKRYEHKQLKQSIYLQTLNQRRYRSDYYPKLYGSFSYGTQIFTNDFNDHFNGQNWFGVSNVGLQIRWNVFDGLATRARIQQAEIDEMLYKSQLENFERSMKLEIRQATTNLRNATLELENQERNLELAQEVFRVTNIKYQEGIGTNLEVVNAQSSLNQAQINYTDAMIQAYIATVDLDKALGNLSPAAYK